MPKPANVLMTTEVSRYVHARNVPADVMQQMLGELDIEACGEWRGRPTYAKGDISAQYDTIKGRIDRFYRELRTPPMPEAPPAPEASPAQASLPLGLPANFKEELRAIGTSMTEYLRARARHNDALEVTTAALSAALKRHKEEAEAAHAADAALNESLKRLAVLFRALP